MATTDLYTIQGSIQPTRKALRFLGGDVDDGVQVDALVAAIVAANHTKGTITAWINIPDDTGTYTIFGAGDANAVEYTEFKVVTGKLNYKSVIAGPTTQIDWTTTNRVLTPNKWHHVAFVQDGACPRFYVDGEEVTAITRTTTGDITEWYADLNNIDGAHIGASDSVAGGAALTNEFKGYISDVKVFSGTASTAALTAEQVKQDMNGVSNTTSLFGWYDMKDRVENMNNRGTYDGTIVGALIYVDGSEFASKLTFGAGIPVTADNVSVSIAGNTGFALVVQQA